MWEGQEVPEVLEEREQCVHNLCSALESAVRSVALARLACDDVEVELSRLRNNIARALEEAHTWLGV